MKLDRLRYMMPPLLKVSGLHTRFKTEDGTIHAVNGVDFSVARGETLCIVGESGCGKSVTALSILGLLPRPQGWIEDGEISFEGLDLATASKKELRRIRGNRISMIFQEPMTSLNPVYRIGEQIIEPLCHHRKMTKKEAWELAVGMLDKVGIPDPEDRVHRYPHELSGGMRQRVMIGMALICDPSLLIADEPTTALDVTIQAQILELINELREKFGTAVLMITHDLGVVAETADNVAVMYLGKIVEHAPVARLFDTPLHPYTRGLMESIPQLDSPVPVDRKLPVISGTVPGLLELPLGCAFAGRCPQVHERCKKQCPPLVEYKDRQQVRCWLYEK
jgi:peptide/nickel transport system ATP-binding protein/oligopeptide transport system ATP-binding protein